MAGLVKHIDTGAAVGRIVSFGHNRIGRPDPTLGEAEMMIALLLEDMPIELGHASVGPVSRVAQAVEAARLMISGWIKCT